MDSSELFSHPVVHEAVHTDNTSADAVAAPVFSDAETTSGKPQRP